MNAPDYGVAQSSSVRLSMLAGFVQLLAREGRSRQSVLEIGSYEGSSALAWSYALGELAGGGELLCVDPWGAYHSSEELGADPSYGRMHAALVSGAAFERFRTNIQHAHAKGPIRFHRGTIADAPVAGLSFDIVYIDGCHHYSAVKADIEAAWPLVNEGGVFCGDDLEKQIERGTPEWERALKNAEFDFRNGYHAGVSLAVAERFGKVWCEWGTWAVRKAGAA